MTLTGFTDEAGQALETQIKATQALGWKHLSARSIDGKSIHDLSEADFNRAADQLDAAGIQVIEFGSLIGSWSKPIESDFAITLGEIERGIRLQEPKNREFAHDLRHWLDRTVQVFADRILEFDSQDALIWGELSARLGHPGADLMIAAQAIARDAAVVTGNGSDFFPSGARVIDPFV